MKFRCLAILSIILLLLTGCSKVPQEVTNNMNKQYGSEFSNIKKTQNNDLEYDTIDNIFKTIDEVTSNNYSNIRFANKFEINKPTEIGSMRFHQISDFNDNSTEIIKNFVGKDFDEQYIYYDERLDPPGPQYDEKGIHFGMGNNGFYCYDRDNIYDEIIKGHYKEIERIPLRLKYKDHSYALQDGEMKISEAIEQAKAYAKQLQNYSKDIELIPDEVIVYQDNNNKYLYQINLIKSFKYLYFSYYWYDHYKVKDPYIIELRTIIVINSSKTPATILNGSGIIEYVKTEETYDEIITFDHATKLVEDILSFYSKYEIQYVNLETKLKLIDAPEEFDPYENTANNIYISRPCWVFYLDLTPEKEIYVTVDCQTGDVDFIKNTF